MKQFNSGMVDGYWVMMQTNLKSTTNMNRLLAVCQAYAV